MSNSALGAAAASSTEGREMRQAINWMGTIFVLCSLTASHAENARPDDPVEVTRSFLGASAASSVDDLMDLWPASRRRGQQRSKVR